MRPNIIVCSNCATPFVSVDGRLVAYEMRPDMGPRDVLVRDLQTGSEELISVNVNGSGGGNGDSRRPLISYDGRYVVFVSKASNRASNDFNGLSDISVRNRWQERTFLVTMNYAGNGSGNGPSSRPVLSADGRAIAFQSFANDLVVGDYNRLRDVFVLRLSSSDADSDGMDDDWEAIYFSTLNRDGLGDFDGDGHTDAQEYRAGTDPANDNSIFRLLAITSTSYITNSGSLRETVLSWSAAPGQTYRVQFKTNIDDTVWNSLPGDVVAGGATATKEDTVFSFGPGRNRFYRVALPP